MTNLFATRVLRGLVCYYRAKFKNGGQVQKMDFLHIYVIDGSLTKHNRCEVFFEKKKGVAMVTTILLILAICHKFSIFQVLKYMKLDSSFTNTPAKLKFFVGCF